MSKLKAQMKQSEKVQMSKTCSALFVIGILSFDLSSMRLRLFLYRTGRAKSR
jgi:hypothetical protein